MSAWSREPPRFRAAARRATLRRQFDPRAARPPISPVAAAGVRCLAPTPAEFSRQQLRPTGATFRMSARPPPRFRATSIPRSATTSIRPSTPPHHWPVLTSPPARSRWTPHRLWPVLTAAPPVEASAPPRPPPSGTCWPSPDGRRSLPHLSQRPSESPEGQDLLIFVVAQDVCHPSAGPRSQRLRQRPGDYPSDWPVFRCPRL